MEYQGVASQNYYNYHEVQLANASYDLNNYFASSMNSDVDVASHNHIRYVASTNTFDNAPHHTHHNYGYYGQEPMSTMNYLANCSQNSAPYANAPIHNLGSHVTSNSSQINENSVRYLSANTHDLASRVTSNHSRINGNLAPYASVNAHNSALYFTHDHS